MSTLWPRIMPIYNDVKVSIVDIYDAMKPKYKIVLFVTCSN
jgi:hypothetical protein